MTLLKRTSQLWKLYTFIVLMALGAGVTLFQSLLYRFLDKETITALVISGMLLVIIVFSWAYTTITCPGCGLKLFWYSISKVGLGTWFTWLINLEECPQCGKTSGRSAPGNKQVRGKQRKAG